MPGGPTKWNYPGQGAIIYEMAATRGGSNENSDESGLWGQGFGRVGPSLRRGACPDLRDRLNTWIEDTNDKGAIPEDPALIEDEVQKMQQNFQSRMQALGLSADTSPEEHLAYWEKELLGV